MLNEAYQFIFQAPLALVFPGLAIMLSVLSFNVVADGLRDAIGAGSTTGRSRGAHPAPGTPGGQDAAPGPGPAPSRGPRPVDAAPSRLPLERPRPA